MKKTCGEKSEPRGWNGRGFACGCSRDGKSNDGKRPRERERIKQKKIKIKIEKREREETIAVVGTITHTHARAHDHAEHDCFSLFRGATSGPTAKIAPTNYFPV